MTEQTSDLSHLLERKQRQTNMNEILDSLNPNQSEFNTMLLGFGDIIQSSFYNYLTSQCKTEKDRDDLDKRVNKTISEVMSVLNMKSLSNPEDMVVLSTIMIEAVAKSLVRQENNGIRVSQKLHNLKKNTGK